MLDTKKEKDRRDQLRMLLPELIEAIDCNFDLVSILRMTHIIGHEDTRKLVNKIQTQNNTTRSQHKINI